MKLKIAIRNLFKNPFVTTVAVISLAFGIVVLVEAAPNRLNDWLAVTHRNGWLFTAIGAVVLLAALLSPVFGGVQRRDRLVQRDAALN